jgi:hypothetical protein
MRAQQQFLMAKRNTTKNPSSMFNMPDDAVRQYVPEIPREYRHAGRSHERRVGNRTERPMGRETSTLWKRSMPKKKRTGP